MILVMLKEKSKATGTVASHQEIILIMTFLLLRVAVSLSSYF